MNKIRLSYPLLGTSFYDRRIPTAIPNIIVPKSRRPLLMTTPPVTFLSATYCFKVRVPCGLPATSKPRT